MSTLSADDKTEIIRHLHRLKGDHKRYLVNEWPLPQAALKPKNETAFTELYIDFCLANVNMAISKAQRALEYVQALDEHSAYESSLFQADSDPAKVALAAAESRMIWASTRLQRSVFADNKSGEELLQTRETIDDFYESFLDLTEKTKIRKLVREDSFKNILKFQEKNYDEMDEAVIHAANEYHDVSWQQIDSHVELVHAVVAQLANKKQIHLPYLDEPFQLNHAFAASAIRAIEVQKADTQASEEAALIFEARSLIDDHSSIPMVRLQSLDLFGW